jgi:hypothetical protein
MRIRAAALVVVLPSLLGIGVGDAKEQQKPSCCFTNPYYAGVCEVRPARDETCASILAYLNNPNDAGKNYCGNTQVRGGWTQARCKAPRAGTRPGTTSQPSAP